MPAEQSSPETWRAGPLLHVIPTASHERFLVKISLRSPSPEAPHLRVDDRQVAGSQTDLAGRCFQFDVPNLRANPLNRYLINSAMLPDLKRDADGGITLSIQRDSPGQDKESNWLPAPAGPFWTAMRLY